MYLNLKVYTKVGVFVGTLNKISSTEEDLITLRDHYQKSMGHMTYLVMYCHEKEISLSGKLLAKSVIEWDIAQVGYFVE